MTLHQIDGRKKNPLLEFAYLGMIDKFLDDLGKMATKEEWDFTGNGSNKPKQILYNYLTHTFLRVRQQGKIETAGNIVCFNTGLITDHYQDIFAIFRVSGERKTFFQFGTESHWMLTSLKTLPERATYFEDPTDLIFDPRLEIRVNIEHIIDDTENFDRFPSNIKTLPSLQLKNTFKGAIEHAKRRVHQNYKTAIPQFYRGKHRPDGELQLLLPLCLREETKADLALAIYKESGFYSGRTCLTLDMAINNARLIAKPDDEWLKR